MLRPDFLVPPLHAPVAACLEDLGSIGIGLLMYMMVIEAAREWIEANREISIGKRYTNFPTTTCSLKSIMCTTLEVIAF